LDRPIRPALAGLDGCREYRNLRLPSVQQPLPEAELNGRRQTDGPDSSAGPGWLISQCPSGVAEQALLPRCTDAQAGTHATDTTSPCQYMKPFGNGSLDRGVFRCLIPPRSWHHPHEEPVALGVQPDFTAADLVAALFAVQRTGPRDARWMSRGDGDFGVHPVGARVAFDTPRALLRTSLCQLSNPCAARLNGNWKMATRDLRPKTADPAHETGNIGARDSRASA
jgi:hypothetical protein